jgi:hypothetical protein
MDDDRGSSDASEAVERPAAPIPWWAGSRARLPALLACLALAVLGLLHSRTGVFSAASETAPSWQRCIPDVPPLATVELPALRSLRDSLLPVMAPLGRSRYAAGTVSTEVAWSDNSPEPLGSSRLGGGLWPASYEMRTWASNGDDIVAEVFLFADSKRLCSLSAGNDRLSSRILNPQSAHPPSADSTTAAVTRARSSSSMTYGGIV